MQQEIFPTRVDFKPNTESVDDQKSWGSCVAHAGQTALEVAFARAGQSINLSRAYLYHWVQHYAGTLGTKDGGYPKDLGLILEQHGCCQEAKWTYPAAGAPDEEATNEARLLFPKGSTTYRRLFGIDQIKRAICQGKPVVIGMAIHNQFNWLSGPWTTHKWDTSSAILAAHAVTVIGFDEPSQRLLCENSWSSSWGDGGFFGMPYDYWGKVLWEAYCFDTLPVQSLAADGYIPESIPTFNSTSNILEIPSLWVYPGSFAPAYRVKNVVLKVVTKGDLQAYDSLAAKSEPSLLYKNGDMFNWELLLPELLVDYHTFTGVRQKGARYELIGFTQ